MINTFSIFYYGYEITPTNNFMNFDEGGGELTAQISIGSYSFTGLGVAIENALNAVGSLTYTVTANRTAMTYTIEATNDFDLLAATGSQSANSPWALIGFSTDQLGDDSYTGTAAGSFYKPQFKLQDYIPTENWSSASQSTVNKTASGRVELIKFGDETFMQCSIMYITDIFQPSNSPILNDPAGLSNFRAFMRHAATKAPIEFMPDVNNRDIFETFLLESSQDSKAGVGFKIREMYDKGLPGWYDSGTLVFRAIE